MLQLFCIEADINSVLLYSADINPGLCVAFLLLNLPAELNMDSLIPSNSLTRMSRYKCSFIKAISKQV
jgi:hypothetical protein